MVAGHEAHREELVACEECDLLQRVPSLPEGGKAICSRCGHVLAARPAHSPEVPLALTLTAIVAYLIAQVEPMMGLSAVGRTASTTVMGGAYQMWIDGEPGTAAIVLFCVVIAPAVYLACVLAVLLASRQPRVPHWVGETLRWGLHMAPWSMYEVMMLGVLVALVKIAEMADVDAGLGMYGLGALVVLFPAIALTLDTEDIWRRIEWSEDHAGESALRPAGTAR